MYFCDQVACSHQIHFQQTNHSNWKNYKGTNLVPDTKFAEQNDENILRLELFNQIKWKAERM